MVNSRSNTAPSYARQPNKYQRYVSPAPQENAPETEQEPQRPANKYQKYVAPSQPAPQAAPRAQAPASRTPLGGATGEFDLSKFEALPKVRQQATLTPNLIDAAWRQGVTQVNNDFANDQRTKQERAAREAQARREASRGYGAGMDMIITTDDQGNLRPGTDVDRDISKGIVTAPANIYNAAVGAAQSAINLPGEAADYISGFSKNPDGTPWRDPSPRADFSGIRAQLPAELQSMSGQLTEGLAQFMFSRGLVGKMAPGGGLPAQLGKDALAVGVGFDGSTGRVADMIDLNAIPEGPLRDYAAWLQTQPDDSPIVGRFKNMLEDMTLSSAGVVPLAPGRLAQAAGNALFPKPMSPANAGGAGVQAALAQSRAAPRVAPVQPPPASQAGPQAPPAGQPSVSPVAQPTVTQGARGGAQTGATGSGQQAAGPATLQASPTVVQSPQAASLARSDAKIIRRLLVAGGVARNDVDRLLGDMVEAFNRSNDPRSRLAFFAEEYLPQQLPKEVAEDVIQKLRGFGRERFGANSPRDPSRSIMRSNIGELRGSQREYLTDEFEGLLGKETLMNKQGKITRDKQGVAEAVYAEEIGRQQRLLADGLATPEQMAARDDLLLLMGREDFFKQVPAELHLKAADEGKSLWEFVHQNPLEAAHWMQSELGVLARKGNSIAQTMRMPLVRRLEDAVPGYRGARLEYGDLSGQQAALEFGDDLYRVAASKFDTDNKALEFKKLSPAQRTVAKKSIRDKLLNEFRKAKTGDQQAAVITAMQKDGVLDALETILGSDGKKVADAIRAMVRENEQLRAVDLLSGSNTADNLAQQAAAREAVRSPINKSIGALGDEASYLQSGFADVVSIALGLPPVWTASKLGTKAVSKFGTPSKKKLASATRTLYGAPPRNALNVEPPPPPAPRAPRNAANPRAPKPPVTQEDLDALLAQYDKTPTPAIRNKIIAARKALGQASSNKLKAPPPPLSKKPPPGTTSNASPTVTGIVAGGIGGAMLDQEDPARGAIIGATGLGTVAGLGNKLSKMGGSKPKTVKPTPGAGGNPPPVGAKAADTFKPDPALRSLEYADQLDYIDAKYPPVKAGGLSPYHIAAAAIKQQRGNRNAALKELQGYYDYQRRNPNSKYHDPERMEDTRRAVALVNKVDPTYFDDALASKSALDKVRASGQAAIEEIRRATPDDGVSGSIRAKKQLDDMVEVERNAPAPYTDRPRASKLASPTKGPGGKPPPRSMGIGGKSQLPASSGFGGGRGASSIPGVTPLPPRRGPPNALSGIAGRAAAGGLIGGLAGSLTGDASAQDDLAAEMVNVEGKISAIEQEIAALKKAKADFDKITDPFEKQRFLKANGLYAGNIDGNIRGLTTTGIEKWITQNATALEKAEKERAAGKKDLEDLRKQAAYRQMQKEQNPFFDAVRELGPSGAAILGGVAATVLRMRGVGKSAKAVKQIENDINDLLTKGPVVGLLKKGGVANQPRNRAVNMNEFYRRGGTPDNKLPFNYSPSGWKPNTKAAKPGTLFKPETTTKMDGVGSQFLRPTDIKVIGAGLLDSALVTPFVSGAEEELKRAQADVENGNTSIEALRRVEKAKTDLAMYQAIQRLGWGVAGAGALGMAYRYKLPSPNIRGAEEEVTAIADYLKSIAPPTPPKPKKSKKP